MSIVTRDFDDKLQEPKIASQIKLELNVSFTKCSRVWKLYLNPQTSGIQTGKKPARSMKRGKSRKAY